MVPVQEVQLQVGGRIGEIKQRLLQRVGLDGFLVLRNGFLEGIVNFLNYALVKGRARLSQLLQRYLVCGFGLVGLL